MPIATSTVCTAFISDKVIQRQEEREGRGRGREGEKEGGRKGGREDGEGDRFVSRRRNQKNSVEGTSSRRKNRNYIRGGERQDNLEERVIRVRAETDAVTESYTRRVHSINCAKIIKNNSKKALRFYKRKSSIL